MALLRQQQGSIGYYTHIPDRKRLACDQSDSEDHYHESFLESFRISFRGDIFR